jgi:hypothetical protein
VPDVPEVPEVPEVPAVNKLVPTDGFNAVTS